MGEPAGIGPDLCVMVAQQSLACGLTVVGDPKVLAARAKQLGINLELREVDGTAEARPHTPGSLNVLRVDMAATPACGQLDTANAQAVLQTIATGVRACQTGRYDAFVTAPVHKGVINDAGFDFSGHTEFIAEMTGGHPVMMLTTDKLRVALVTTHLPLKEVSAAITRPCLETVLRILHGELSSRFGIDNPRILVCGLNPHAGEGGHLGREEIEIIEPTLAQLRAEGMLLNGPLPADTLFLPKYLDQADAVLAMYHDQGLPVLKYQGFGRAVNITLGLSIIRTSVDHGTALDLAGTGRIDDGSLLAAIGVAIEMSQSLAAQSGASH
jgi:4-hydroxythreonine-4-phosphate dehydrogenase